MSEENCQQTPYRKVWDEYVKYDVFGGMESIYKQTTFDVNNIRRRGYIVNKSDAETWDALSHENDFTWKVFDRIRHVEEMFSGLFKTEDEEFKLIFPQFIKHALFSDIYLIYSEELKEFELEVLEKFCEKNNADPIHRLNKAIPESNFRLYRRVYIDKDKYVWEAVLSELRDLDITPYLKDVLPVRCSFNEGYMFIRLHNIFKELETMKQAYIRLFFVCNKSVRLITSGADGEKNAIDQLFSVSPVFKYDLNNASGARGEPMELIDKVPMLTEYYDNIENYINDELNKLGLGGDDSTKCERITTGENFRAMQPCVDFQQALLSWLNNIGTVIQKRYSKEIKFELAIQPTSQGIPQTKEGKGKEKNETDIANNAEDNE